MRKAFIRTLVELADLDPRIVFLTGDLGFTVVEPFASKHPDRFFNAGVAEQNMVGVATGLAEAGFIPFVYSIVTFASLRPYEFIRNGPVLQRLPVRIVAVGGGFEYGSAGPTHFGLEDLGIMRMQPELTVICPADHRQAAAALKSTWDIPGPVYYRVGKDDVTTIPGLDGRFTLGATEFVRNGDDLLLLATGAIASEGVEAAEELESAEIDCAVAIVPTLNPVPQDLIPVLKRYPLVISVEAHYVTGGLGSMVAELIADHCLGCRLVRCGVKAMPDALSGSETYLNNLHGLSAQTIVKTARMALQQSVSMDAGEIE